MIPIAELPSRKLIQIHFPAVLWKSWFLCTSPTLDVTDSFLKIVCLGFPWWSSGWESSLQCRGTWVHSLVGELRSHMSLWSLHATIRESVHISMDRDERSCVTTWCNQINVFFFTVCQLLRDIIKVIYFPKQVENTVIYPIKSFGYSLPMCPNIALIIEKLCSNTHQILKKLVLPLKSSHIYFHTHTYL